MALVGEQLYRQSGRRRSAKLVPTFAGRGVSRGQRNGSPRPLNVESDNNKILYETLLDIFTAKRYLLSESAWYMQTEL